MKNIKLLLKVVMVFAAITVIGVLLSQNASSSVGKFVVFIGTIAIGSGIISIAQIYAKNNM